MLVESRSGKSGCSFEVVLEAPEAEFVMVTNDGRLVSPRTMPKRLQEATKAAPTDVVKKTLEANARRASEVNRVRYAAHRHNVKVVKTVIGHQQQYANMYWQLDSKLRAADRRREDIVSQIRAKAQEHSARVVHVHKNNEVKVKTLDNTINECLIRAAENRNKVLRDTRARIASQNLKVDKTREAQRAEFTKSQMDAYWSLDRKLHEAERRRRNNLNEIRERAASPSEKCANIRSTIEKEAEEKFDKLSVKLEDAAARKEERVRTVKAKAQEEVQKVDLITREKGRKVEDLETANTLRLRKAEAKRAALLEAIRRQQKRRALKAERVRQTKRIIAAQQ